MKRVLYVMLMLMLLTGCKSKYTMCKIDLENENYKQHSEYKIFKKGNYATKVEKVDIYESKDRDEIDYLEETNDLKLSLNKTRYKGYEYTIKKDKYKIEINTTVDIESLDMNKIILDKVIDRHYIKGNRIDNQGLIKYYKAIGAKCEEE